MFDTYITHRGSSQIDKTPPGYCDSIALYGRVGCRDCNFDKSKCKTRNHAIQEIVEKNKNIDSANTTSSVSYEVDLKTEAQRVKEFLFLVYCKYSSRNSDKFEKNSLNILIVEARKSISVNKRIKLKTIEEDRYSTNYGLFFCPLCDKRTERPQWKYDSREIENDTPQYFPAFSPVGMTICGGCVKSILSMDDSNIPMKLETKGK